MTEACTGYLSSKHPQNTRSKSAENGKMVNSCRVHGCHNRSDRERHLKYYCLPKVVKNQGQQTKQLSEERRRLWIASLNQNFKGKNLENIRICSSHFVTGKFLIFDYLALSSEWNVARCIHRQLRTGELLTLLLTMRTTVN